ncbi:hypothetical protein PLEOSDRAFT_1037122, partial [Pleurotus ostreatus PC15]
VPIPVPNLTKKSRGRRVPTVAVLQRGRSSDRTRGGSSMSDGAAAGSKTSASRMYTCTADGCGKCFARGEHLKRHVRSIHTYEKRTCKPVIRLLFLLWLPLLIEVVF